ncbi:MAG: hypothetical protein K2M85_09055 [Paramuribaculum sp.]|nr:hypothetical protein [Paramuribaculum sp.]
MKKTVIAAAVVAAVGFLAYFGFGLRPDSASSLTELQLANAEVLSDIEGWIENGCAKNCQTMENHMCVRSPHEYHDNSAPFPYFN